MAMPQKSLPAACHALRERVGPLNSRNGDAMRPAKNLVPRRDPSLESRHTAPHGADSLRVTIVSFAVLRIMTHIRLNLFIGLMLAGLLLAACGGGGPAPAPVPAPATPDAVGTQVAQALAVAATLTALAPRPDTPAAPIPQAPVQSPVAATPTRVVTTIQPLASPTRVVVTVASAPIIPPLPQPTRVQVAVVPVDGSDGNRNLGNGRNVNEGRNVLLPGFATSEVTTPVAFRDKIVFQVEVFDSNAGRKDGAGIDSVTFTITDESGAKVHERTEKTPGYCVFGGGEPDCTVWRFSEHGYTWPGGAEVRPGIHDVQILITPRDGAPVTWFWSFRIEK
jgi:hypothetical protein